MFPIKYIENNLVFNHDGEPEAEKVAPYSDEQAEELLKIARHFVPNAALR